MATSINGVELDILNATLGELQKDASLGKSEFRASNRWQGGTRNVNRFETYHALKQEMSYPQVFEVRADEPPMVAGGETAPNPVEYLLAALASCVTSSIVIHAAAQGIEIESIESKVEGDIDLNGFAGFSEEVPKGFQRIRLAVTVASDADAETLKRLAEFSPTLDTISRGTPVDLTVEKRARRRAAASEETTRRA